MNHQGISAMPQNANLVEIDDVQSRKVVRHEREGAFAISRSEPGGRADDVSLIRGRDMVCAMLSGDRDSGKNTDTVRIKRRPPASRPWTSMPRRLRRPR